MVWLKVSLLALLWFNMALVSAGEKHHVVLLHVVDQHLKYRTLCSRLDVRSPLPGGRTVRQRARLRSRRAPGRVRGGVPLGREVRQRKVRPGGAGVRMRPRMRGERAMHPGKLRPRSTVLSTRQTTLDSHFGAN